MQIFHRPIVGEGDQILAHPADRLGYRRERRRATAAQSLDQNLQGVTGKAAQERDIALGLLENPIRAE